MEIYQLRYFVAVAETGSFSRAAERCHVTQPSLSQQIMKLEQEIGQRLFDRAGRKVLLTDAGRFLLEHAQAILTTADNAARQLRCEQGDGVGRLAIGVIPTIAPYLLPKAVEAFTTAFPKVELMIQEDYTQRLVNALCEGDLDVAIAALPIRHDQLAAEELGLDPLLLVLPRKHPLVRRRGVGLKDIQEERFVVINDVHCLGEHVMSFCRQHEFQPNVVCRSAQVSTVQELVGLGQGISLLPAMARDADSGSDRVYRELSGDQPVRTIVAVRHRHRYQTPYAKEFVETVRGLMAEKG
jgi:LysR family hydrogen peroxide-inducible transcriptional activator